MDLYNPVGWYRLLLCSPNRLTSLDPLNNDGVVSIGSRDDSASYDIVPYGTSKTQGRSNRNKELHTLKATSKQLRLRHMNWLTYWLGTGFDCQYVGEPDSGDAPAGGGQFNWISAVNQIGLDFVYRITNDVRNCDITLERADNYEVSRAFIDAADNAASLDPSEADLQAFGWANQRGEFVNEWVAPYFFEIKAPNNVVLFDKNNIVNRMLEIRTISNKNGENRLSRVRKLGITCEVTLDTVRISDWNALKNKDLSPSISIKEYMANGVNYEAFDFDANILSMETENKKGETEGFLKIKMSGEVTLRQLSFLYGVGNGGTVGSEYDGGTWKFSI